MTPPLPGNRHLATPLCHSHHVELYNKGLIKLVFFQNTDSSDYNRYVRVVI